jgi:hypothetical protein
MTAQPYAHVAFAAPSSGGRFGWPRTPPATADTYTHVLMDYREIDRQKLLKRVRTTHPSVHPSEAESASFAATF